MTQKLTIIFDLDGTLVDTAPDLMNAHNHVMRKFGYETKTTEDIRNLVGKGAKSLIGRSVWGQAKKEFSKVDNDQIKNEMTSEFIDYYSKNIAHESKLINGALDFLKWCKKKNISMGICTNKQDHLAIDLLKKINVSRICLHSNDNDLIHEMIMIQSKKTKIGLLKQFNNLIF